MGENQIPLKKGENYGYQNKCRNPRTVENQNG